MNLTDTHPKVMFAILDSLNVKNFQAKRLTGVSAFLDSKQTSVTVYIQGQIKPTIIPDDQILFISGFGYPDRDSGEEVSRSTIASPIIYVTHNNRSRNAIDCNFDPIQVLAFSDQESNFYFFNLKSILTTEQHTSLKELIYEDQHPWLVWLVYYGYELIDWLIRIWRFFRYI